MYPSEMRDYINSRNGKLNREETNKVIDVNMNPQLNHITYNVWDSSYDMWDREGNHFKFYITGE